MDYRHLEEIIRQLAEGIDPTTGEIIPDDAYLDPGVFKAVKNLSGRALLAYKGKRLSRNLLNRPSDRIFDELKAWRLDEARQRGLPAYVIFSDADLRAIAEGDVIEKEDLLKVKGFGPKKMEMYGDDVYEILKEFIAEKPSEEPACVRIDTESRDAAKSVATVDNQPGASGLRIKVGCSVHLMDLIYDQELSYLIVDQTTKTLHIRWIFLHGDRVPVTEEILESGGDGFTTISPQSELGSHLMGKNIGDHISYTNLDGNEEHFEVLGIIAPEE